MLNTYPCNPFPQSTEQAGAGSGSAYELPIATADTLGGIKVGDGLSIDSTTGALSAPAYTLPVAAADTLGGIKVGSGLSIDSTTGALSATAFSISSTESIVAKYDNKDLYARTFTVETLPNNTTLNITSTELNNCRVVYILGAAYSKSTPDTEVRPIPFAGLGANDIRVEVTNGKLAIRTGADWSTFSAEITVFYTKNTL